MTDFRPGRFQVLPTVVKNIIIINVLMVLIQYVLGQRGINLGDYLGLHHWTSDKFGWWQIFTHMFMHGDPFDVSLTISHIFFNMFALFMFGGTLENLWGPKRFIIFYLVCGVGAAFCHLGVLTFEFNSFHNDFLTYQNHPGYVEFLGFARRHGLTVDTAQPGMVEWAANRDCVPCINGSIRDINEIYRSMTNTSMVGASGAIFGVLFAFGYLFPNTLLYVYFAIPVKAKYFIAIYAIAELFMGVRNSSGDNVAHFAHLGGMLFAFILLKIWQKTNRRSMY